MLSLRRLALLALALFVLGSVPLAAQGGPYRAYLPQLSGPPLAPRDLDGVWSGTTSAGKPFSFVIVGGALKTLSFAFAAPGCGISNSEVVSSYSPPIQVGSNGSLSVSGSIPGPLSIAYTASGALTSLTTAAGALSITVQGSFPGPSCREALSQTWTATRGGPTQTPTRTGTPSATPTPRPSPTTSPALSAQVRLINNTGGALSFDLSGPTDRSGSMFTGQTLTIDVAPGVYALDATGWCGSATDVFRINSGELREVTYTCGGGAAPGLVSE